MGEAAAGRGSRTGERAGAAGRGSRARRPPEVGFVEQGSHYLRRSGRSFLPVGAHFVPREGPDWPWRVGPEAFDAAFAAMARAGLDTVRIDLLWAAIEPRPGEYDEAHLRRLDEILAAARRHGLLLHPALLVGGEVGDAFWDVPWRAGRHPHRDPELTRLQKRHLAMLGRRWRDERALLAWDLTDEPPFWLFQDTTDDEAGAWTGALAGALRSEDPHHLVTVGTASQDVGWGPFRADVVAPHLDFATVHPYPIYSPELYPDTLLGPRMTHSAAFETALAAGAGRPVMVHEYGASGAQFDPERLAAYDRLLAWSSLGRGAIGFLAWCWTDAEPAAYRRAPYVRAPHETQFGVTDWRGETRPRGRVLAELAATVRRLDLDRLAADGPAEPAAIVVPHEYVRPYDPTGFGLSGAPAGDYEPADRVWHPRRDGLAFAAGLLNADVLAARAGIAAAFPRERLDGSWPAAPLVLLPAPLASTSGPGPRLRTSFWAGARDFLAGGGTAYLSLSAESAIPEMADLAGCRPADRAPAEPAGVLRFVEPWGPFRPGDELQLPAGDGTLATRGVRLALAGATPVALDAAGEPALVAARRGSGAAVTCAHPIELLLARVPDAHGPSDRTWGIYAGALALARSIALARWPAEASVDHPDVTVSSLGGPGGGIATLTNHAAAAVDLAVRLPGGSSDGRLVGPDGELPLEEGGCVRLEGYGAAVLAWDGPRR